VGRKPIVTLSYYCVEEAYLNDTWNQIFKEAISNHKRQNKDEAPFQVSSLMKTMKRQTATLEASTPGMEPRATRGCINNLRPINYFDNRPVSAVTQSGIILVSGVEETGRLARSNTAQGKRSSICILLKSRFSRKPRVSRGFHRMSNYFLFILVRHV